MSLKEEELERYQRHFETLLKWNDRADLISPASLPHAFAVHYLDSIYTVDFAMNHMNGVISVADLGTGAGFPGLIGAIRYPEFSFTLYERISVKRAFLKLVVGQLELKNVAIYSEPQRQSQKDLWFARAVLQPRALFSYMAKHLVNNNLLVLNTGGVLKEIPMPDHFELFAKKLYGLPNMPESRAVFLYRRVSRETSGESG